MANGERTAAVLSALDSPNQGNASLSLPFGLSAISIPENLLVAGGIAAGGGETGGLLIPPAPQPVVQPSLFSTAVNPLTGQTTYAGIPLMYLLGGGLLLAVLLIAVRK